MACRVEADVEVRGALLGDVLEALSKLSVTGRGFGERQLTSGGLEIVTQEGGVVPIT